jgi:hypothetical protein
MVRAAWMEKILSKTDTPSAIKTAATRVLADSELDTVVGGTSSSDWVSWTRLLAPPIPYPGSAPVWE